MLFLHFQYLETSNETNGLMHEVCIQKATCLISCMPCCLTLLENCGFPVCETMVACGTGGLLLGDWKKPGNLELQWSKLHLRCAMLYLSLFVPPLCGLHASSFANGGHLVCGKDNEDEGGVGS